MTSMPIISIKSIPTEILSQILLHLPKLSHLLSALLTNRKFYSIINDDTFRAAWFNRNYLYNEQKAIIIATKWSISLPDKWFHSYLHDSTVYPGFERQSGPAFRSTLDGRAIRILNNLHFVIRYKLCTVEHVDMEELKLYIKNFKHWFVSWSWAWTVGRIESRSRFVLGAVEDVQNERLSKGWEAVDIESFKSWLEEELTEVPPDDGLISMMSDIMQSIER